MVKRVSIVGHITTEADEFIGRAREVTVDTERNELRVHDGVTPGGSRIPTKVLNDTFYQPLLPNALNIGAGAVQINAGQEGRDFEVYSDLGLVLAIEADTGLVSFASDLTFAGGFKTDTIQERTAAAGVTIDGVLVKDGFVDGIDVSVLGSSYASHAANVNNPHAVTKNQVGLGNVNNVAQQPLDSTLTAFASLNIVANKLPYGSGSDAFSLLDFDATARTLLTTASTVINAISPVGMMAVWPLATPPSKWLVCNGQAVSRTTYSALFTLLGTTYGAGNGSTTFNLPDLRGRVVAGLDAGANRLTGAAVGGVNAATIGAVGGEEAHAQTIAEMAEHGHPWREYNGASSTNQFQTTGGIVVHADPSTNRSAFTGTPTATAGQQIGGSGNGDPANVVQPTIALQWIMYAGV